MEIDEKLTPTDLLPKIDRLWATSGGKIESIEQTCPPENGAPVFTVDGRYTAQGWTEWTEGFRYGSALLQFDATGDDRFLTIGRDATLGRMASHVSHVGVHDHGFTNVSTYGALLRLMREGRVPADAGERAAYEIALRVSGAVQAARWRTTADGTGYIYSFNGPQSLFVDTIRSCRALAIAHQLGHVLMGEQDRPISLLGRLVEHARNTARWNVFYGNGRDRYDVRGRTAHESVFNVNDGAFRCPSTQQGYSPFSTWTRGLAWAMAGYPELLEWVLTRPDEELETVGGRESLTVMMLDAATATCDFYLANTPTDGIPYWDTGAPGLAAMGDHLDRPADPFNEHEPVDSSAAAIAAQGLLRLGRYLGDTGTRYWQAGLTVCDTLLDEPYLSTDPAHQGLLLHSVYHQPNGWDHVAPGQRVPNGEACMWGDYHLREVAVYVGRVARDEPYYTFFGGSPANPMESTVPGRAAAGEPGESAVREQVVAPAREASAAHGEVAASSRGESALHVRPVALVTGASRGIGRGVALALGGAGYDVVVNYVRDATAARRVSAALAEVGVRGHLSQADISVAGDRERLVADVYDTFGRLDLLVNNAGVGPPVRADILRASEESFHHMIGVNLRAPYFLTQLVANRMVEQLANGGLEHAAGMTEHPTSGSAGEDTTRDGSAEHHAGGSVAPPRSGSSAPKIVIISSISAYTASVNRGDYCVAKAGLAMTAKLFAARLAAHGINVYEIRPGIVETDMTGPVRDRYDDLIHNKGLTPIARWGVPDDVGRAVVAVATDLLPFSTGQVIDVDGGFHLRVL